MNFEKWISCSERLPEVWEDVLVTREYDDAELDGKHCVNVTVGFTNIDCDWELVFYEEEIMLNHKVIAWMPLPEPYECN